MDKDPPTRPLTGGCPETSHGTCRVEMGTVTSYLSGEQRGLVACHTVRETMVPVGSKHMPSSVPSEKP